MTATHDRIAPASPDSSTRKSRKVSRSNRSSPNRRSETTCHAASADHGRIDKKKTDAPTSPPASSDRLEALRDHFFEIHQPETAEELHLVECLAIARAKLETAEKGWHERLRWQKAHAAELFERGQLQRFQADLKQWRADPWGMRSVFGKTWHSATFLKDLWHSVREAIDSKAGLTFDQIKQIILTTGGDWRVDRLDTLRGRLMCAFLGLHPDPERFLDHWVAASRARRPDRARIDIELDRLRARAFLEAAPAAERSRAILRTIAEQECSFWTAEADRLQAVHLEERARCAEVCPSHPLGDAAEVRETRRLRQALTTAENRFETLERHLMRLISARSRSKPGRSAAARTVNRQDRTTHQVSSQDLAQMQDTSHLRNGSTVADLPVTIPDVPDRPARRPDPKLAAKAWRAKHGKCKSA